ncbi:MAG: DUF4118 domain-containing protein [Oligoflexia bacterium]|nr:DUF4118 domain-containing protein [Oligoflexia bacterium]
MAGNLNAAWLGVFVETEKKVSEKKKELMLKYMTLVKQLGGEVVTIKDDDEVSGLLRVARSNQITQIVFGRPKVRGPTYWFRRSFIQRFLNACEEVDIYLIGTGKKSSPRPLEFFSEYKFDLKKTFLSLIGVGLVTLLCFALHPLIGHRTVGLIYLIYINVGALYFTGFSIFLTSIVSGLLWNYFFIVPNYTLFIANSEDWILFGVFFVCALIVGTLSSKLRNKENFIRQKDARSTALLYLTSNIFSAKSTEEIIKVVLEKTREIFQIPSGVFLKRNNEIEPTVDSEGENRTQLYGNIEVDEKEYPVINWVLTNNRPAGKFTDTLPSAKGYYLPIRTSGGVIGVWGLFSESRKIMSYEQQTLIENFSKQLALGIEREYLLDGLRKVQIGEATEKIYNTLLSSVSYELKNPLGNIEKQVSNLVNLNLHDIAQKRQELNAIAVEILLSSKHMQTLIQNFLDISSIEAGKTTLNKSEIDFATIINNIINQMNLTFGNREIELKYSTESGISTPPKLFIDAALFEQAIKNVIQNAYMYSNSNTPIKITTSFLSRTKRLEISISDQGVGLPSPPEVVFKKFYRAKESVFSGLGLGLTIAKAIIEMHEGEIIAENLLDIDQNIIGANFKIRIPQ